MRTLTTTSAAAIAAVAASVTLAGCGGSGGTAIGTAATVQLKGGDVAVKVTKVEKGSVADLEAYYKKSGISVDLGGKTPYYVHYELTNTGGKDLSGAELGLMSGLDKDDTALQSASGTTTVDGGEEFTTCPQVAEAPDGFAKKGASFETCTTALAGSSEEVVGGNYVPDDVGKTVQWKQ